jgi:polyisoprenoid-binding protein YceI
MNKILSLAFFVSIFTINCFAQTWKVQSSTITFKIKNAGFNVSGKVEGFKGTINFDPANVTSASIVSSVEAATLDTDNNLRNSHLKEKPEFFDVAKYPTITMKSTKITKTDNGYSGTFDLTMKGVTKAVTFPFTFESNAGKGTFKGNFTINRRDWNVGGSSWIMSDNANVSISISVIQ